MAQTKDLRLRSTVADTPDAGVARYYANSSGILRFVHPNGTDYVASTFYPTTVNSSAIQTGGIGSLQTGLVFGLGTAAQTGLGSPHYWIRALAPDGTVIALPGYKLA